jgi:hypothetical protein
MHAPFNINGITLHDKPNLFAGRTRSGPHPHRSLNGHVVLGISCSPLSTKHRRGARNTRISAAVAANAARSREIMGTAIYIVAAAAAASIEEAR